MMVRSMDFKDNNSRFTTVPLKPYHRWNLKNLSRGLNPPTSAKTQFKFSVGLNLETILCQFCRETTINNN